MEEVFVMYSHESEQPLVSICVPVYNAEKTIVDTIQSILSQTYNNLEIVIVENASKDHTSFLLEKFNDKRIKIYKNSTTVNAEQNFTKCVELASGEFIAIFHSDDLYKQDMVEKQIQVFQENPSLGAVFTMANLINELDEVIGERKLLVELKNKGIYYFFEIFTSILINGNFLICPSAMVKSELYKELVPFDRKKFGSSADLDMWLRILERCPIAILNEKLMSYRISKKQYSHLYNYLRTDEADFFKVMDYYLTKKIGIKDISNSALNSYELQRYMDNLKRAVNYTITGQSKNAKILLKQSFSTEILRSSIIRIKKPKYFLSLLFGVMFLFLIDLKLGKYPSKAFYWIYGIINPQPS